MGKHPADASVSDLARIFEGGLALFQRVQVGGFGEDRTGQGLEGVEMGFERGVVGEETEGLEPFCWTDGNVV